MKNDINTYCELFQICQGTQEYFWNQVREKLAIDDKVKKISGEAQTGNKEYYKNELSQMIDGLIEQISVKTSIVLMGIITQSLGQSPDKSTETMRRFDSRIQELTSDYLLNSLLKDIISKVEKDRSTNE